MNLLLLYFLIILCKLCNGQEDKIIDLNYDYDESKIPCHFINLTSSNFDDYVQSGKKNRWLIIFYTEKCAFCKQIKSMMNKIIESQEFINDIKFGKVDLTYNLRLQIRFNLTQIPYIILVNNYKMYEMQFLPTEKSLTNFIDSQNLKEFEEFKKDFPQELSFFEFMKNLVNFSFQDGSKRINSFLKEHNISFQFTPLSLFLISMIIGVPIATLINILIFGFLCRKNKKPSDLEQKFDEKKEDNNNTNNKNDENQKVKNE